MGVPMRPRGIMATKLRKTTYMRSGTLFSGSTQIPERINSCSLPSLCHSHGADSQAFQLSSSREHHSGLIPALPEVPFLHLRHSRCGSTSILGSCEGERPQRTPHTHQRLLSVGPQLAPNLGRS